MRNLIWLMVCFALISVLSKAQDTQPLKKIKQFEFNGRNKKYDVTYWSNSYGNIIDHNFNLPEIAREDRFQFDRYSFISVKRNVIADAVARVVNAQKKKLYLNKLDKDFTLGFALYVHNTRFNILFVNFDFKTKYFKDLSFFEDLEAELKLIGNIAKSNYPPPPPNVARYGYLKAGTDISWDMIKDKISY